MQTAQDLMTKTVIVVHPETPLIEATNILLKNKFNGLPVVDSDNILVGVLTEYDLILKGTAIHLPTFLQIFQQLELYKKGSEPIRDDLKKIFDLKVGEVMNNDPLSLDVNTSILQVADVFSQHHRVNPIPIVDGQKKIVGIITRYDLLKFLGDPSIQNISPANVDEIIDQFLNNYQNKFILVAKFRTRFWLLVSVFFAIVGFVIAFALILRIR